MPPRYTTQLRSPEGGISSEPWSLSPQAWRPQLPSPVLGFGKYQLLSLSPKKKKKKITPRRQRKFHVSVLTWPCRGSFPAAATCLPSLSRAQSPRLPTVAQSACGLPSPVPEFSDPFCQCSAPGPGHLPRPGSKTQSPTPWVSWLPDWPPCHPLSSSSSEFQEHS